MRHAWFLIIMASALPPTTSGYQADTPYEVVGRIPGTIAVDLNAGGEIIGFIWAEEPNLPGVVAQVPFHLKGETRTTIPLLDGYTSTFPAAISDTGLVVGRVSKPFVPGVRIEMQNQAFTWDAEQGIRGLGVLGNAASSFATGVSADGRRISGYVLGEDRIRPCVWDRDGGGWAGTTLPVEQTLGSNVVAISGNGRFVSAVDGVVPCLWSRSGEGVWTREVIGEPTTLLPRAVNDEGMVVGLRFDGDGKPRAMTWTRDGGLRQLQEPDGFVKSEASAVNNRGVVVGMVDGPSGSDVFPRAFAYEGGRLRLIDEGTPALSAATAINDRGQIAGVVEEQDAEPTGQPDPAGQADQPR